MSIKCDRCVVILHQLDAAAQFALDGATLNPGGDAASFGSTNDLDYLREAREALFDHWAVDGCPNAAPPTPPFPSGE